MTFLSDRDWNNNDPVPVKPPIKPTDPVNPTKPVKPKTKKPAYAPTLADSSILFTALRDMRNPALTTKFKIRGQRPGRPTLIGSE